MIGRGTGDEIFSSSLEIREYNDSTQLRWGSRLYGVDRSLELSRNWERMRGCDPQELLAFIERLVGGLIRQWHQRGYIQIAQMCQAMIPMWEANIFRFMEGMEQRGRHPAFHRTATEMRFIEAERVTYRDYHLRAIEDALFGTFAATPPVNLKAKEKARQLLLRHLDAGQQKSFKKDGTFKVTARDGKRYTIATERSFNVTGPDGVRYCGQILDTPVEDQMLAQKILLETDPRAFFLNANRTGGGETYRFDDIEIDPGRVIRVTNLP